MMQGPPSTSSFVERELMDPHNVMESGSTINGLRDSSIDSSLDFLKQPVDMGVRGPVMPRNPALSSRSSCAHWLVARRRSWRLRTMVA